VTFTLASLLETVGKQKLKQKALIYLLVSEIAKMFLLPNAIVTAVRYTSHCWKQSTPTISISTLNIRTSETNIHRKMLLKYLKNIPALGATAETPLLRFVGGLLDNKSYRTTNSQAFEFLRTCYKNKLQTNCCAFVCFSTLIHNTVYQWEKKPRQTREEMD